MPPKKAPVRMLPQNQSGYLKFKQWKYSHPFPDEYKRSAKALMLFDQQNVPVENTIQAQKNLATKNLYKLALLAQQHNDELNYLLNKFEILQKNRFISQYEAKVLITELLFGKQNLKSSNSKVEAIKFYEEDLREAFIEARDICNPISNHTCKLPVYIRINTLSISIEDTLHAFSKEGWNLLPRCNSYSEYLSMLQDLSGRDFIRDYHISELLAFPPATLLYNHPGYIKGKFVYQDKGSCLSSFLLNPKPNSIVLDACAAPGLKTNHLANIMAGTGLIYANDIHPERVNKLNRLLNITETNARVLQKDFMNLNFYEFSDVKYILIDPSCTYSGIFFAVGQKMKKFGIIRKQVNSSALLRMALQSFPNVKRVVYTTCSLYEEECEDVVTQALNDVGDSYTLLNVKEMLWNQWDNVSQPGSICSGKCLRVVPEYDLCQGYFIAVFERNFDVPVPPYTKKIKANGDIYSIDEVEKVEKVTDTGRTFETFVPKEKFQEEHLKKIQELSKLKKKVEIVSKHAYMFNQQNMKTANPYFQSQTNFPTNSGTITNMSIIPPQVFETTHSQLYP